MEEAEDFLAELDESSERIELQSVGESVQGRPINLVTVGVPAPRTRDQIAQDSMILFNCSIHGDEPSGREDCLQLVRDMSTTADPALTRLLRQTTVGFIFSNPDGWVADTRENADGADVNRDFLALATPEGRAIATVMRDYTGLKHITGQLTEAASGPVTPQEQDDPLLTRRRAVTVQYASGVGSLAMVSENRGRLARQSEAAAERAIAAGAAQSGVVYFSGQDDMLPTTPDGAEPGPLCGYQLTPGQVPDLGPTLELHDVAWEENADGALVTMAQPGRPLIPLLLDERSEFGLTEATPLDDC